jgi:hypothetical protein
MTTWKARVAPALKLLFDRDGKKAAAAEFIKSFNKEEVEKEIDEKKTELEPKVLEVYEASPPEIKHLVKERKSAKIAKKYSTVVTKFLEELVKIEFPGAQAVSEGVAKSNVTLVSGPIIVLFDKIATFLPKEEPKVEEAPAATEEATREVTVEAEKKEETETSEKVEETKTEETSEAAAPEAPKEETKTEEPKTEKTKTEEPAKQ